MAVDTGQVWQPSLQEMEADVYKRQLKKELRKRLETYRANGAAWIAALPLKTRMGYELFSMSPGLYAKMLQKMQETS